MLHAGPLEAARFAPFGQVIEATGAPGAANQGRAQRFDTTIDLAPRDARAARLHTAVYRVLCSSLPFTLKVVERHPLSPQLFFPNSGERFLVCACPNLPDGNPDLAALQGFIGSCSQGIVWGAGVWHSPFAALGTGGDFLMQQWLSGSPLDCEEHHLAAPVTVQG